MLKFRYEDDKNIHINIIAADALAKIQGICNHGIGLVCLQYLGLSTWRIITLGGQDKMTFC